MKPGGTALTVIPSGPYSSAKRFRQAVDGGLGRDIVRHARAPECVLDELMFTMRPQPASTMSGSTA